MAASQASVNKVAAGLDREPPGNSPAKTGKTIYMVSCGQVTPGCSAPTAGVVEAGKVLGWNVKVVDGKLTPAGWSNGIKQAVAAKADGIITAAIDCASAKAAYQAAKAANIPTVSVYSVDCPGDPVITKTVPVGNVKTWTDLFAHQGTLRADYTIAKTAGKAKVIALNEPDFATTNASDQAYKAGLKACSGCQVVASRDFTAANLAAGDAGQIVSTLLQQHPEATVLNVDSDTLLAIISQSLRAANRKNLIVIGGEGYPTTFSLIRSGFVSAAFTFPSDWFGWAAADTMNRLLSGAAPASIPDEGADVGYVDAKTNLPSGNNPYAPKIDFKAAYTKSWKPAG